MFFLKLANIDMLTNLALITIGYIILSNDRRMEMLRNLKLALLGIGISHSLSPQLHKMLGAMQGIATRYDLIDLEACKMKISIADEIMKCADNGYDGINITHPFKLDAYLAVENSSQLPSELQSINTVVFKDNKMIGYNTDYSGFIRGFENSLGQGFKPGAVFQLGAGGVGYALNFGIQKLGATKSIIYDKNKAAAEKLVNSLLKNGANAQLSSGNIAKEMQQCDGLINATPLGMHQYPVNGFPENGFTMQSWAFDAVYTPIETKFLKLCISKGIKTVSGFQLFFFQGINAFEKFSQTHINHSIAINNYHKSFLTKTN